MHFCEESNIKFDVYGVDISYLLVLLSRQNLLCIILKRWAQFCSPLIRQAYFFIILVFLLTLKTVNGRISVL